MKLNLILTIIFIFSYFNGSAQNGIAINTTGQPPDSSAIFDIQSDSKGLLVPRMSSSNRTNIPSPATGLIIYDLDENAFFCFAGSGWIKVLAGFTSLLSDEDSDTKIEVEQTQDDDLIRFTTSGVERWRMQGHQLFPVNTSGSIFIGEGAGETEDLDHRNNIAIGRNALNSIQSQGDNVAIGDSALFNNGNGIGSWVYSKENTAIGSKSMLNNLRGQHNTAVGYKTLYNNDWGGDNIAIGGYSLFHNDNGDFNIGIGNYSLYKNESGLRNLAIGYNALYDNVSGDGNVALGPWVLKDNTIGTHNTAIGYISMLKNIDGIENTAVGYSSLVNNEDGDQNTAVGVGALYWNETGHLNTASGSEALYSNISGSNNSAIGERASYSNTTGHSNVAIGSGALFNNDIQSNLVAIGDSALYNNRVGATQSWHGHQNTAVGSKALFKNTIGVSNTAIGYEALFSNLDGYHNSALGYKAMNAMKVGDDNTAIGYLSMANDTAGIHNISIGYNAMISSKKSDYNTVVGSRAMESDSSGSNNTAIGYGAMRSVIGGDYNTALGRLALNRNLYGNGNVAIGNAAGSGAIEHSKSGGVFIGQQAGYYETEDDRLYIANSSTTTPLIYGEFDNDLLTIHGTLGVGTITPDTKCHIVGGTDTKLSGGGYLTLGDLSATNISFDDNEIQARDNGSIAGLFVQTDGGIFKVHHALGEITQFIVDENGKTGIGENNPTDKLHINTAIGESPFRVQLNDQTKFRIHDSGGISIFTNTDPGENIMRIETGVTDLIIEEGTIGADIRPTGDYSGNIGTSTRRFLNMRALNFHGTLQSGSDIRMKENIGPISHPLKILKQLEGLTYAFKKDYVDFGDQVENEYRRTHQLGVIAQDVEKILPQLVHTDPTTGLKSVEYIGFIPILIEAVKDQNETIDRLRLQHEEMLSALEKLQSTIDQAMNNPRE